MTKLCRLVRRTIIRWQLRNLEEQAASIMEARQHALARLMDIQRESVFKQELLRSYSTPLSIRAARW
ncbi:MAG TPA: hypothetical protein VF427_11115 [Noviherbaspirillum sp.]